MDRALGELDAAFYDSGGVLSPVTCRDTRAPTVRPRIERSDRYLAGGSFTATRSLGVPECVELGGFYQRFVVDGPDDATDYASYEVEGR